MSRGQENFVKLPALAAGFYDGFVCMDVFKRQNEDIAHDLLSGLTEGVLLDIGCGPGWLLKEVHTLNPHIELFGLDISAAMCARAGKNLAGIPVDLQCSDIRATNYADDHFDVITCCGSFFMWDNPAECFEEIYRILKPGRKAMLFDPHSDVDEQQVKSSMKKSLQDETTLRRWLITYSLTHQLNMTYSQDEVEAILQQTSFADSFTVEPTSLASIPIWLRIKLRKPTED